MPKIINYNNSTKTEKIIEIENINYVIPADIEILQLKEKLNSTDYQAIKYAEGQISDEDYAPIKEQRQTWRDRINVLESEVQNG